MILVAGGTGRLGSLVVGRLVSRGLEVRVLTREPQQALHLAADHVQVMTGDVRDRESLGRAAAGADVVVSAVHGFAERGDRAPRSVAEGLDRSGFRLVQSGEGCKKIGLAVSIEPAEPDDFA